MPQSLQPYEATMNEELTEIAGVYGLRKPYVPLVLKRTDTPDKVPEPLTEKEYASSTNSDLQGYWKGILGRDLHVRFKIAAQKDGSFRAEFDNPDQGYNGQPVNVLYEPPSVILMLMGEDGAFDGELDESKTNLSGTWAYGKIRVPVSFSRADPEEDRKFEVLKDYSYSREDELQGHWKGDLEVQGKKARVALDIAKLPDDLFTASMTSMDLMLTGDVPASTVRYTAPKLHLRWKSFGIVFDGSLENGKLRGAVLLGFKKIPLILERAQTIKGL
jgi:hypothetical protein